MDSSERKKKKAFNKKRDTEVLTMTKQKPSSSSNMKCAFREKVIFYVILLPNFRIDDIIPFSLCDNFDVQCYTSMVIRMAVSAQRCTILPRDKTMCANAWIGFTQNREHGTIIELLQQQQQHRQQQQQHTVNEIMPVCVYTRHCSKGALPISIRKWAITKKNCDNIL